MSRGLQLSCSPTSAHVQLESQAAAHLYACSHAVLCCDLACNFLGSFLCAGVLQKVEGLSQLLRGQLVLQKWAWRLRQVEVCQAVRK